MAAEPPHGQPPAPQAEQRAPSALASLGAHLLEGYIAPVAGQLVDASSATVQAVEARCAQPTDATAQTRMDRAFGSLVHAWGRVELLRFGPLVEGNRLERFFFFPDPRGVVQRQLGTALSAMDPALLAPGALAHESVALQGLPALEFTLYGAGADAIGTSTEAGQYRCRYAQAVAANLAAVAQAYARSWQADTPLAREFAAPHAQGQLYRTPGEVATEALKAISGNLHYLRDVKLAPALGPTPEQARGQRAPLWRSGNTVPLLRGNVQGLRDLIAAAAFEPALPPGQRWIPGTLLDETERILQALDEVTLPMDRAVTDPTQRQALAYVMLLLKNLQDVTDQDLAPALGVNLGFNAFDGD